LIVTLPPPFGRDTTGSVSATRHASTIPLIDDTVAEVVGDDCVVVTPADAATDAVGVGPGSPERAPGLQANAATTNNANSVRTEPVHQNAACRSARMHLAGQAASSATVLLHG
jgi:hypothetical protein